MNVGEAADRSGLPTKTIRYYEEIGLLTPDRKPNGYRDYSGEDVHRLAFLRRARGLGFSIGECRQLMALRDRHRASQDVRAIAVSHVDDHSKIADSRRCDERWAMISVCHGGSPTSVLDDMAGRTRRRGFKAQTDHGMIWDAHRLALAMPLADGQSDRANLSAAACSALSARRGTPARTAANGRRATSSRDARRHRIVEIKTSIEDFRTDRKWPEYRLFCDRFFFATHPAVDASIFPPECGFILSDGYGAEILREAPEHRLTAPARKALTLRIARIGAARLTAAEVAGIPVPALDGEAD